jgi:hypothetical protein
MSTINFQKQHKLGFCSTGKMRENEIFTNTERFLEKFKLQGKKRT